MSAFVYFALIDDSAIKIGATKNMASRMRQHEKSPISRHDVKLLAYLRGTAHAEKAIHDYFEDHRLPDFDEMFHPTEALTDYIRWLRDQWFTAIDLEEGPDAEISFEFWCPNKSRRVAPTEYPLFKGSHLDFNGRDITKDDYYTPENIIELARQSLGSIDLDPASHPVANRVVKATSFYTVHDNGLKINWNGNVWLNPPFSQWKLWAPKVLEELESGRVSAICILSAMRTVTAQYFTPMLRRADAVCIMSGRHRFGGNAGESPDDGHCIMYMGNRIDVFADAFQPLGTVWKHA
jgi:hypothetical protein